MASTTLELLISIVIVAADVESTVIQCAEDNLLCLDKEVLLRCKTLNPFIEWYIPFEYPYELDFNDLDEIGHVKTLPGFTAELTDKFKGSLTSELTFTPKLTYNNTNITCFDGYNGETQACYTTLAGRPSAPLNIQYQQNSDSVNFSWGNPIYTGGEGIFIDYYKVTVYIPWPKNASGNWSNFETLTTTTTFISLHGMECQSLNITIYPVNCIGLGTSYSLSIVSEPPDNVTFLNATVQGNQSVLLQWMPPLNTAEDDIHYAVSAMTNISGSKKQVWNTASSSILLTNLTHGELLSVQAVNCHGEGHPVYISVVLPNHDDSKFGIIFTIVCIYIWIYVATPFIAIAVYILLRQIRNSSWWKRMSYSGLHGKNLISRRT